MRSNRDSREGGFSLLEMMIAIAVIGLFVGLSIAIFRDSNETKLSETAQELSSTIRYVYSESAVKNRYHRLVINFEERSFSVEASAEPFKIDATDEGAPPPLPPDAQATPALISNPDQPPSAEQSPTPVQKFAPVASLLVQPIQLPEGILIKDVYVAHAPKKIEKGKTAIYFFPNGWVEKGVINLTDETGELHYSIETFSMTGKTKIRAEYFDYLAENKKP